MKEIERTLVKVVNQYASEEGFNPTPIKGVHCIKRSNKNPPNKHVWHACLGIVLQGVKEVSIEQAIYKAKEFHYTVTPVDLPVVSAISGVSKEKPFLALLIEFDHHVLSELTFEMEKLPLPPTKHDPEAIYVGKADTKMIDAVVKLVDLFQFPDDAQILGPLVVKEIFYHLLKGPNGNGIRNFVRSGSGMHKVASVIHKIKAELNEEINVEELAKSVNMSRSLFFRHFKNATNMSPIQYQKRLRLIEAKRLMIEHKETAESAAFKVGYNSPSQFNREYSRMFGHSPIKDVKLIGARVEGLQHTYFDKKI